MTTDEIKVALTETFQALKSLQDTEASGAFEAEVEEINPAMGPRNLSRKIRLSAWNVARNSRCCPRSI